MMSFLAANLGTIVVLSVLVAVVALIIRSMVANHRNGKGCADCHASGGGCGCGCGCAHASSNSAATKH